MDSDQSEDGDVALANLPLSEVRRRQRQVVALLRDAEHWRRLVAARLDLAIAAVTDIDDLTDIHVGPGGGPLPKRHQESLPANGVDAPHLPCRTPGDTVTGQAETTTTLVGDGVRGPGSRLPLRDLLGIPRSEGRLPESALLLQLRDALRELDTYTGSLRSDVEATARVLASRFDDDELDTFGSGSIAGS